MNMNIKLSKFIPIVAQLGSYLKIGIDHYADLRAAGNEANTEIIAAFLTIKMQDWNPKIGGVELLDGETRYAAARFIAGISVNIAGAQK